MWRAKKRHNSNLRIWWLGQLEDDGVIGEIVMTNIGRGADLGRGKKYVVLNTLRLRYR